MYVRRLFSLLIFTALGVHGFVMPVAARVVFVPVERTLISRPPAAPAFAMQPASGAAQMLYPGMPDTVDAFRVLNQKIYFKIGADSLLWFELHWRTENDVDFYSTAGYYTSDDSITLPFTVPSAREGKVHFWAFVSKNRAWSTQVWYGDSRHVPIRAHEYVMQWSFDVGGTAASPRDSLLVFVTVRNVRDSGEIFPYLFCDLIRDNGTRYARAIGYNISRGMSTFVFPFVLGSRAWNSTLRTHLYLTDGTDPDGPVIADTISRPITVGSSIYSDTSKQRLRLEPDGWYLDRKPIFLIGANVVSNWVQWDSATLVREVSKMSALGFNYIRLWWDWSAYEPSPGVFSSSVKAKIALMLAQTEARGIFVELVPVGNWGGWQFDLYRDHWWTDTVNRNAQYRYFYEVAQFVKSTGARNIAYISLMQEGGSGFDWFDPMTANSGWHTYPGPLDSLEALADWKQWLEINMRPANWTYDSSTVEYGRWCSERFNDLIALRLKAVRDASHMEFRTGLEGSQGGFQYDRTIVAAAPSYYLKPERWCHLVDVAEIHSYVPNGFTGYWAYENGITTYVNLMKQFGVASNVGEYQYTWAGHTPPNVNNDSMPYAWQQLKTKIDHMKARGVIGCAIWDWADYDDRRFGMEDKNLALRPIADSLAAWMRTWMPMYGRDHGAFALFNNDGMGGSTDPWSSINPRMEREGYVAASARNDYDADSARYRYVSLPVYATHCRDDINHFRFALDHDSALVTFIGSSANGEFATERAAMAHGFAITLTSETIPIDSLGNTRRTWVDGRYGGSLPRPVNETTGCLLDTAQLLYLHAVVRRPSSSAEPLIVLHVDSTTGFDSPTAHFRAEAGGLMVTGTGPTMRPGTGRVGVRIYNRPVLAVSAIDSAVTHADGSATLRDTLTFEAGDTARRTIDVALENTTRGSVVFDVAMQSDRQWCTVTPDRHSPIDSRIDRGAGLGSLTLHVAIDPRVMWAAGDTAGVQMARIYYNAFEILPDSSFIDIPVRWNHAPVGVMEQPRDAALFSIAPNPVGAGQRMHVLGSRSRQVDIYDMLGRCVMRSEENESSLRAPIVPGCYAARDATGRITMVVVR